MKRHFFITMIGLAGCLAFRRSAGANTDLRQRAEALTADPKYLPDGDITKCNIFARDLVQSALGVSVAELVGDANEQYTQLNLSPSWQDITDPADWPGTYDTATRLAKAGIVVIAAWPNLQGPKPHGHIAVVMPLDRRKGYPSLNSSKGYDVPIVAQAGKPILSCTLTGVDWNLRLSCAFGVDKQGATKFFRLRS